MLLAAQDLGPDQSAEPLDLSPASAKNHLRQARYRLEGRNATGTAKRLEGALCPWCGNLLHSELKPPSPAVPSIHPTASDASE